jgi:hypothetical protein
MCTSESSCGCATATAPAATVAAPVAGGGSQAIYTVAGVTDVDVDVSTGKVTVTSTINPPRADIRAAVEEAGYRLAD